MTAGMNETSDINGSESDSSLYYTRVSKDGLCTLVYPACARIVIDENKNIDGCKSKCIEPVYPPEKQDNGVPAALCKAHCALLDSGSLDMVLIEGTATDVTESTCDIIDRDGFECVNEVKSLGMCSAHYMRLRRGNDIYAPMRKRKNDDIVKKMMSERIMLMSVRHKYEDIVNNKEYSSVKRLSMFADMFDSVRDNTQVMLLLRHMRAHEDMPVYMEFIDRDDPVNERMDIFMQDIRAYDIYT